MLRGPHLREPSPRLVVAFFCMTEFDRISKQMKEFCVSEGARPQTWILPAESIAKLRKELGGEASLEGFQVLRINGTLIVEV